MILIYKLPKRVKTFKMGHGGVKSDAFYFKPVILKKGTILKLKLGLL